MGKRMGLKAEGRQMITNVSSYIQSRKAGIQRFEVADTSRGREVTKFLTSIEFDFIKAHQLTARLVGVSERTVRRYRSYDFTQNTTEPEICKRGRKRKKLPKCFQSVIRDIIISMYCVFT